MCRDYYKRLCSYYLFICRHLFLVFFFFFWSIERWKYKIMTMYHKQNETKNHCLTLAQPNCCQIQILFPCSDSWNSYATKQPYLRGYFVRFCKHKIRWNLKFFWFLRRILNQKRTAVWTTGQKKLLHLTCLGDGR